MAAQRKTIIRSRAVRRRLLETLDELRQAAPGMGMSAAELIGQAGADSPFGMDDAEVQAEIVALADHKLVEIDQRNVRITTAGADFVRAGMPWDRIDTFSGGVR